MPIERKWLHKFPFALKEGFDLPFSWGKNGALNKSIIETLENLLPEPDGSGYVFGCDSSFAIDRAGFSDKNPHFMRRKRQIINMLERHYDEKKDPWFKDRINEVKKFRPQEIMMLDLHGLKDQENENPDRLIKGLISDLTEFRYGTEPYGKGWYDYPFKKKNQSVSGDLEIRIIPLAAIDFISAYNYVISTVSDQLQKFGVIEDLRDLDFFSHLNISRWRNGKPFKDGINICLMESPEDQEAMKKMISGLCFLYGPGTKAGVTRYNHIRIAKGRFEVRICGDKEERFGAHIAKDVLDAIIAMEDALGSSVNSWLPESKIAKRTLFKKDEWLGFLLSEAYINDDGSLYCDHIYKDKPYINIGKKYYKLTSILPVIKVEEKNHIYRFSVNGARLPEEAKPYAASIARKLNANFIKVIPTVVNTDMTKENAYGKSNGYASNNAFLRIGELHKKLVAAKIAKKEDVIGYLESAASKMQKRHSRIL